MIIACCPTERAADQLPVEQTAHVRETRLFTRRFHTVKAEQSNFLSSVCPLVGAGSFARPDLKKISRLPIQRLVPLHPGLVRSHLRLVGE